MEPLDLLPAECWARTSLFLSVIDKARAQHACKAFFGIFSRTITESQAARKIFKAYRAYKRRAAIDKTGWGKGQPIEDTDRCLAWMDKTFGTVKTGDAERTIGDILKTPVGRTVAQTIMTDYLVIMGTMKGGEFLPTIKFMLGIDLTEQEHADVQGYRERCRNIYPLLVFMKP